jgi:hypothetical protein
MALLTPTNCSFDVYRGYAPATPYVPPNRPAALIGITGAIKQHVRNGRFGYQIPGQNNVSLHWTTVLLVRLGRDLRDAYNSELNADTIQNGDTVMVADYPNAGTCCAFVVVMIQRVNRGGSGDYLRLYLDRARPNYGTLCPDPTQAGGVPGCDPATCATVPEMLTFSWTDAGFTCTLTWDAVHSWWQGAGVYTSPDLSCTDTVTVRLYCSGTTWKIKWNFQGQAPNCDPSSNPLFVSCSPFHLSISTDGCPTCYSSNAAINADITQ